MKRKTRRMVASWLCFILCFAMNINPLAVVAGAIVDTGVVDRFTALKNNLIWVSETCGALKEVRAEEVTVTCECDCDYDYTSMLKIIMESGSDNPDATHGVSLKDIQDAITSQTGDMNTGFGEVKLGVSTLTGAVNSQIAALGYSEGDTLKMDMGIVKEKLQGIIDELQSITGTVGAMQHRYYVAHLYSLNNSFPNALWRPYSDEVPYVKDFATVTGKFANVYTGYWDSYVQTVNNPGNMRTNRTLEILGYDAICRAQGVVLQEAVVPNFNTSDVTTPTGLSGEGVTYTMPRKDVDGLRTEDDAGNPVNATGVNPVTVAVLVQEYIPEDAVCWIDAVTLLYKALGQEQYTYQSFMAHNNTIIPERSPAFQNLANPIPNGKETSEAKLYGTDSYNGFDFYMFLCRDNLIVGTAEKNTAKYLYWDKALSGGFLPEGVNWDDTITFAQFFKLASKMMQAYGEPVMNDDELKALLQVYGTHYPIQLGADTADAWAYLAARGILDFSEYTEGEKSILYDIVNTGTITRDQLLTMAMRIKDKDSRTNFKDIQIVLDLADVMKEDYYYPVYDMAIANGQMSVTTTYDHRNSNTFEYLIQRTDKNSLGESGTPMVYSKNEKDDKYLIEGAEVSQALIEIDNVYWYKVSVPKDYDGNFYIGMKAEGGSTVVNPKVEWIEVPSTALGGGYYAQCTVLKDIATVSYAEGSFLLFDSKPLSQTKFCTDWKRAGLDKQPAGNEAASNATVLETILCLIDRWTTPMYVEAKQASIFRVDPNGTTTVSTTLKWANSGASTSSSYRGRKDIWEYQNSTQAVKPRTWSHVSDILSDVSDFDGDGKDSPLFVISSSWDPSEQPIAMLTTDGNTSQSVILNRLSLLSEMSYLRSGSAKKTNLSDMLVNSSLGEGVKEVLGSDTVTGQTESVEVGWSVSEVNGSGSATDIDAEFDIKVSVTDKLCADMFLFGASPVNSGLAKSSNRYITKEGDIELSADLKCSDELIEYKQNLVDVVWNSSADKVASTWVSNGLVAVLPDCIARNISSTGLFSDVKLDTNNNNNNKVDEDKSYGYVLYGTEQGVKNVLDQLGRDNFDDFVAGSAVTGTATGSMLEISLYTTTVMDKNQHIMISWSDLKKTGFISTTETSSQPQPRSDGAYYFMCKEGQVIVNDLQHTIQIGTTIYDLSYDNGKSPTLVYYDTEQGETYFDVRCVMGLITEDFSVDGCVTFTDTKSLGSGSYVKYDLGSSGAKSDLFTKYEVNAYNFPEMPAYKQYTASRGYTVNLLSATKYDSISYNCKACYTDVNDEHEYWNDNKQVTRLQLSSYVPTANWVAIIDHDGTTYTGSLFVWYMRTAFEDGYVDRDGTFVETQWNGDDVTSYAVPEPDGFNEVHTDIQSKVQRASNIISTQNKLDSKLASVYGFDWSDFDSQPWYIKMSCEAAAHLYELTDGKYYLSQDYVIREFDITGNSIADCKGWELEEVNGSYVNKKFCANDPGAIYWVDKIGFVYNMPTKEEFSMKDYLEGKYALPLAIDYTSDASDPKIINYNVNYYGCYQKPDGTNPQEYALPYGVVLNPGVNSLAASTFPYITIGGAAWTDVIGTSVAKAADKDSTGAGITPFVEPGFGAYNYRTSSYNGVGGPTCFINAPTAIYNWFGGNDQEVMTVDDLTKYITDAARVYYGSAQVRFTGSEAKANTKNFLYVSDAFSELSIPSSATVFRVYRSSNGADVLIIDPDAGVNAQGGAGTQKINLDDYYTNPLEDWLKGLGTNDLITAIDSGASLLIVIAFNVMPWIGIILMTILIGLAFIGDNKFVQAIADKTIDPVRILTFGGRDIHNWHWRKVLLPCILLYVAFALFLNGNIIRIVMWGAEWYGTISKWARSL